MAENAQLLLKESIFTAASGEEVVSGEFSSDYLDYDNYEQFRQNINSADVDRRLSSCAEDKEKKDVEALPPVDHTKIYYAPFNKRFYKGMI